MNRLSTVARRLPSRRGAARCGPLRIVCLAAALVAGWPAAALAGAVTDGSVGAVVNLSGAFTVPQSLGTVRGGNLFHSFSRFNVAGGESATFTLTDPGLRAVISRVTGAEPTLINGPLTLRAAGGGKPDFVFVNPNGITVGAGGSVDVPAALHLSTAHRLGFEDGFAWQTRGAAPSSLSLAPLASFGFVDGAAQAPVQLRDTALQVPAGQRLDITAGAVDLQRAAVSVPGGQIAIVTTGAPTMSEGARLVVPARGTGGGVVVDAGRIDLAGAGGPVEVSVFDRSGTLSLRAAHGIRIGDAVVRAAAEGSVLTLAAPRIDIDGQGALGTAVVVGNEVRVVGRDVTVTAGGVVSAMAGTAPGGRLSVDADTLLVDGRGTLAGLVAGSLQLNLKTRLGVAGGGQVGSTYGAGQLLINAPSVSVAGAGSLPSTLGANLITLEAGEVNLSAGGLIALNNDNGAAGAALTVHTDTLTIDGQGMATYLGTSSDMALGGTVTLQARRSIAVRDGGLIGNFMLDTGAAGRIAVTTPLLQIDGRNAGQELTGIQGTSLGQRAGAELAIEVGRLELHAGRIGSEAHFAGAAGGIGVRAGEILLADGGSISASTAGSGRGGAVRIEAGQVDLRDGAFISAVTQGSGDAGTVDLQVTGALSLSNLSQIVTSTQGSGRAGTIHVRAGSLALASRGFIASQAESQSTGGNGNVTIQVAGLMSLHDESAVTIANRSSRADPNRVLPTQLSVQAGELVLDHSVMAATSVGRVAAGAISLVSAGRVRLSDSVIATAAEDGDGGPISLRTTDLIRVRDSAVVTSVDGLRSGNGGNIGISGRYLLLESGLVEANTTAPGARGGTVGIAVDALIPNGGHAFVGGDRPHDFRPGVPGLNVIQAAAPDGVSGRLDIRLPQVEVAGMLAGLRTEPLELGPLSRQACDASDDSSLTLRGRGGLVPSARQWPGLPR